MSAITRNLKLNIRGAALDVPVRVFWPVEDKGGWDCRWEIVWPDRQRTNSGRGSDAIQALLNALQMAGTEIYCSGEHRSGALSWHDHCDLLRILRLLPNDIKGCSLSIGEIINR